MRWILKYCPVLSIFLIKFFHASPVYSDLTMAFRIMEEHQERVNYTILAAVIQIVVIFLSLAGLKRLKRWNDGRTE